MTDPFDLQRFVDAQAPIYQRVLAELRPMVRDLPSPHARKPWPIWVTTLGIGCLETA